MKATDITNAIDVFVKFVFSSVLFSAIASTVQLRTAAEATYTDHGDALSRCLIAVVGSFYYYLLYIRFYHPHLSSSVSARWIALLVAVSTSLCSSIYLFIKTEFYAMGALLLVSSFCFYILARIASQDHKSVADHISRCRWHCLVGAAVVMAGLCRSGMLGDGISKNLNGVVAIGGYEIGYLLVRLGIVGAIIVQIHMKYFSVLENQPAEVDQ